MDRGILRIKYLCLASSFSIYVKLIFFYHYICLQSGCDDKEFAVELINKLVQAFLAAHDTRAQVREGNRNYQERFVIALLFLLFFQRLVKTT